VLQGKLEQGMPSLSMVPENEDVATASFGSNLYPKCTHITFILKIIYLWNPPLEINMTLIYHVWTLTYLKWQYSFYSVISKTAIQVLLIFSYVSFGCQIPDNRNWCTLKKGHCWLEIPAIVKFSSDFLLYEIKN
jgi:hypothetical protein